MEQKLVDVASALTSFVEAKVASTQALTTFVTKFNARASQAEQIVALTTYVTLFNEITKRSNELRSSFVEAQTLAATLTVSLQNLTDAQIDEMKTNPQQYFCAGYLAMVNSLMFYTREQGLAIADMVHTDLRTDINNAFNDFEAGVTPTTFPTAVLYDSGHALELVVKAITDATPPATA